MSGDSGGSGIGGETQSSAATYRSGFAALVGRPNTGKSTLLNALIGRQISIVTPKPQTTRYRILGISTGTDAQIVFVDTPGIHRKAPRAINRYMNRSALSSLADADVELFVIEALRWTAEDENVLERIRRREARAILVVNKVDTVTPRERLLPFLAHVSARYEFAAVVPVSALKRDNLDALRDAAIEQLPVSPALFPPDQITDRDARFRVAELVREQLTLRLHQEVPYGLSVEVERYEERDEVLLAGVVIWVDRKGQKPIVVGRGGNVLKAVGTAVRRQLESERGGHVRLDLWVKVRENWSDNERALREFGYELP